MRVKSLIRNANPVPPPAGPLSDRAARELAALVGPDTAPARRAPARGPRLALAVSAAAAVIAAALFFGLRGGDGPGEGGPGGGGVMADEPYYGTTAELERAADVVLRVRLGAGRPVDDATTVAPARVLATGKGRAPDSPIEVAYSTPGTGPETAPLTAGEEYVLLLSLGEDGRYYLVSSVQGWYEVDGGRTVGDEDNAVRLSPGVREALGLAG
nr:hypothetical protein [Streptomyces polyasparticus]